MPIGFARVDFVKRSEGKTAVGKAAYNSRDRLSFEGNCALDPKIYDFSFREKPAYHEILLPEGVHSNFKVSEVLWNMAEGKERKVNSQVAIDMVLALPDDEAVSIEDRFALTRGFVEQYIVQNGFAAQIDIHPPERKIEFEEDCEIFGIKKGMSGVILKEKNNMLEVAIAKSRGKTQELYFNPTKFNGYKIKEHNWHAHVLATTRRFKSNGLELEDHKPRELLPQVRKGRVVSGLDWGKLWTDYQNSYFKARGMALRVDPVGIVPQEHLGPVRMRGRAFDLFEENQSIKELNNLVSQSPKEILKKITEKLSVFTHEDVDRFFEKHIHVKDYQTLKGMFWKQEEIIRLIDKNLNGRTNKFSTKEVFDEEKSILRIADRIRSEKGLIVNSKETTSSLTIEQARAFSNVLTGPRLACVQGYAGTGKSYLLTSLAKTYQNEGYNIRAFGPDNATVGVLKEKGFVNSENVSKFLFAVYHDKRSIHSGKEVWFCDEAGKLGNKAMKELLKYAEHYKVQLIFSGDSKQLPSVGRGGMFKVFNERYGCEELKGIQRQKNESHREISSNLAMQKVGNAINKLAELGGFVWSETRQQAMEEMITQWGIDSIADPEKRLLMMAHTNAEVRVLNELARVVLKERGKLGENELLCETSLGPIFIGKGDKIEFRKNNAELGVTNGLTGVVQQISEGRISVVVQKDQKHTQMISFDPTEYRSFQLGYASTYFRAQGATVDKAYVLHSPHINKELFYVALTRHVDEAHYYLSKDEVPNLVALKNMALRDGGKESTVHFIGEHEQKELAKNEARQKEAEALKRSEQLGIKIKGFGLSTLNYLKEKGKAVLTYYEDKKHDKTFYHRQAEVEESRGVTTALTPHLDKTTILGSLKLLEEYLKPMNEKVDVSKNGFVSAVINKSFAKNMPLAEKLKWGNIVYQYELRNKEVLQSRLEKASDYSEKEVESWKFQKKGGWLS